MSLKEKINSERGSRVLEIIVVIFLGITSVVSAFSAWQSGLHSSAMSKYYNDGIATVTDGNSLYVEAGQVISSDMALYMELIRLEYDWMYSEVDSAEEAKSEEIYNEYANKFIGEELQEAIDWAAEQEESTGYYVSPFEYEPYIESVYADADATYQEGRDMLEKGHEYNTYSDKMGLIVVYYAMVLFLLGICGTLKNNVLRFVLILFSAVIFIVATAQMVQIPFLNA